MDKIGLILLVFAFVCFVISCFQAAQPHWQKLLSAGLACLVAAMLFGNISAVFK